VGKNMLNLALNRATLPQNLGGGLFYMNIGNVYQDKKSGHWYIQLSWDKKPWRFYLFKYSKDQTSEEIWLPFESEGLAWQVLSLMREEIKNHTFNPLTWKKGSPLGISEYSKIWLETSDACKNTKKVYRNAIKHAIQFFGADYDIRKFSHSKLLLFLQSLELSGSAKYNILTALKTMLKFYHKTFHNSFFLPSLPLQSPNPQQRHG